MSAPHVVEVEVGREFSTSLGNVLVSLEVHLLVFHAPPQPLDEDVVQPAAPAVHADGDAMGAEQARESLRGELGALDRC